MSVVHDGVGPVRRLFILISASTLMLSSAILSSSIVAVAQGDTWVQSTRQDFANGTGWNIDVDSDPGNITLQASTTTWIESQFNPGLRPGPSGSWDDSGIMSPAVIKEDGVYKMWYAGDDSGSGTYRIGYAVSNDGVNWTKPKLGLVDYGGSLNNNIVLGLNLSLAYENASLVPGTVIHGPVKYQMWYSCKGTKWAICYAESGDGLRWYRYFANPVIKPGAMMAGLSSPAVTPSGSRLSMWFTELNSLGHYHMKHAVSFTGEAWGEDPQLRPVGLGESGGWFDGGTLPGTVQRLSGVWQMWYAGLHGSVQSIGFSNSTDGSTWVEAPLNPIQGFGLPGSWDSASLSRPSVILDGRRYRMWFAGFDGIRWAIGTASSALGERPVPPKTNPALPLGDLESWDSGGMFRPSVLYKDRVYHMWYTGSSSADGSTGFSIGYARSSDGVSWEKPSRDPVLEKSVSGWDGSWVGFAWVVRDDSSGGFRMWYTGSDGSSIRIGLASSSDGISWQKNVSNPAAFVGNLSWLNPSDIRCPWVGYEPDRYVMFAGTRTATNVSLARFSSWDGGQTWGSDDQPFLTPVPGTWADTSVSCPTLYKNETGQSREMWFEGSSGIDILGRGGIGHLVSDDSGKTYRLDTRNPVLSASRTWDSEGIGGPAVVGDGSSYRMWFHGSDGGLTRIGSAVSSDGQGWHEMFVLPPLYSSRGATGVSAPTVFDDAGWLAMYLAEESGGEWQIRAANYNEGTRRWFSSGVIISGSGSWDSHGRKPLAAIKDGSTYRLWYAGLDASGRWSVGYADSQFIGDLVAHQGNPILTSGPPLSWDSEGIDGASVVHPGLSHEYEMWYSGFDGVTWRIGYAFSSDGKVWTKPLGYPILYPSSGVSWDCAGVSSPRVIIEGGLYHMFYSGYDGSVWSLGHAFSENGFSWVRSKYNPILGGESSAEDPANVRDSSVLRMGSGYDIWFSDSVRENSAIGYAQSQSLSVGTLTSAPVDSGIQGTTWETLNVASRGSSTAKVSATVRTGMPPFLGASWSSDSFSSSLQLQVQRNRYLQYRLTLISLTGEWSPTVEEVSGVYLHDQGPVGQPASPAFGQCIGEVRPTFRWDYSDSEGDPQGYFYLQVSDEPTFTSVHYSVEGPLSVSSIRPSHTLEDGMWFWRVQARDAFMMLGPWSSASFFCVDTAQPRTELEFQGPHLGTSPTYISGSTLIWLNMTDPGCGDGTSWFKLDGLSLQRYTSPFTLPAGHHTIVYNSTDLAGNQDTPQSLDLWVDVTAPMTNLWVGSPNYSRNGILYVSSRTPLVLDSTDAESGLDEPSSYQYGIDTAEFWISGSLVEPMWPGPHTLYYRAVDRVGNAEAVHAVQVFGDDVAPATSLTINGPRVGGSPVYVTPSTTFNLTATDGGAGVKSTFYTLDGVGPYAYSGNFSISAGGFHTLEFFSMDNLENAGHQPITLVEVDGQGPATSPAMLGPSYQTITTTYVTSSTAMMLVSSDASSGLDRVYYRIDSGGWIQYSSPFSFSGPGDHTLSFYGVDVLGNVESTKIMDVFVDDVPPETVISLNGLAVQYGGLTYMDDGASATLSATDNGSGVLFVRYRLDGGSWNIYNRPIIPATSGTHVMEFQATDNLGLVEPSQLFMAVIDTSPPVADAGHDIAVFAPAEILLDGLGSTDDTMIVSYEWVAESNHSVVLSKASGTVLIQTPRDYIFTLKVRDPLGRVSIDSVTVKVLRDPDSDKDTLPDVWEIGKFGNLSYGPGDDPDGDGVTNIEDYGREQGGATQSDLDTVTTIGESQTGDAIVLLLLCLLGVITGTAITQSFKIRGLKRRLADLEAEKSIEIDDDEEPRER